MPAICVPISMFSLRGSTMPIPPTRFSKGATEGGRVGFFSASFGRVATNKTEKTNIKAAKAGRPHLRKRCLFMPPHLHSVLLSGSFRRSCEPYGPRRERYDCHG